MSLLNVTVNAVGKLRYELKGGRRYLVAPVSMIVPGVLHGNKGPLLYSAEELSKDPTIWNGTPIVITHPRSSNGTPISARTPEVLEKQIGIVLSSRYSDKLLAEAWVDIERANQIDSRVVSTLESGRSMELSTGLFADEEESVGVFNGREYKAVARNFRPDHLAFLPDDIGACSIKDGCGVLVNQGYKDLLAINLGHYYLNQLSHKDVHSKLTSWLRDRFGENLFQEGDCFLVDVFDKYFIYRKGDKLYRLSYKVSQDKVTVAEEELPVEVTRVTSYKAISNQEVNMDREKIINELISNCSCWNAEDQKILESMSDEQLKRIKENADQNAKNAAVVNAVKKGLDSNTKGTWVYNDKTNAMEFKPSESKPEPNTNLSQGQPNQKSPKEMTDAEWLANAPAGIRNTFEIMQKRQEAEKNRLIGELTANLEDGDLKTRMVNNYNAMTIEQLEDVKATMAHLRPQVTAEQYQQGYVTANNYVGIGVPPSLPVVNKDDVLPDPEDY